MSLKKKTWQSKSPHTVIHYITATPIPDRVQTDEEGNIVTTQWKIELSHEYGPVYTVYEYYTDEPSLFDCVQRLSTVLNSILLNFARYGEESKN